ncbi:hypothetical protein CHELA1G11_10597 [Hyphomicrobiales bacterium]|nr:hypothetical protein CHELA1G11_10597 [Hyphomicrobiales bacterium]CAH1673556.1 hypothetical protein CHELA1G2_13706 [Hyphomicrobiales bacterium]
MHISLTSNAASPRSLAIPKSTRTIFTNPRIAALWTEKSDRGPAPDEPARLVRDGRGKEIEIPLRDEPGIDFILSRQRGANGRPVSIDVPREVAAPAGLSGRKARSWPAMERANNNELFDTPHKNRMARQALERFVLLYDAATLHPLALHSPCASIEPEDCKDEAPDGGEDGEITGIDPTAIDLCGEIEWDDDPKQPTRKTLPSGFGFDRYLDLGPAPEALVAMAREGRVRINHCTTLRQKVAGRSSQRRTIARLEIRCGDGRWRPTTDGRLRDSKPKDGRTAKQRDAAVMGWTRMCHPSRKDGARQFAMEPFDRLAAKHDFRLLRHLMGRDMLDVMRMAACECATMREIGEAFGKTYKRAEAEGLAKLRIALELLQWAFSNLNNKHAAANDNEQSSGCLRAAA